MALTVRTLHRGRLFTVFDCACRVETTGFSPPEDVEVTQLVIARSGYFVRRIGSREIGHEAGSASVFVAGESHAVGHPCEGGDHCASITPTDRAIAPLLDAAKRTVRRSIPLPHDASILLARLSNAAKDAAADRLSIEEAAAKLYSAVVDVLLGSRSRTAGNHEHDRIVERARDFLAANFRHDVDLDAIAAAVECSPFHLCRVFKAATGRTLAHHRIALRVLAALEAIESGAKDLTALALELGFSDHAHLTNSFRRCFGTPPSHTRSRADRAELRALSNRLQAGVSRSN